MSPAQRPKRFERADAVAADIIDRLQGRIVLGLPLGLGKANRVVNALYRRAAADASVSLHIFTALTLERPVPGSDLERRFLDPFMDRLMEGVPSLDYAAALRDGSLPANIRVSEFFFLAGRWLSVGAAQRNYVSANYTHAPRILADMGVNVIAQMVAPGEGRFSLSSNSDITLDLLPILKGRGQSCLLVGEVNANLPYMPGPAELPADAFDLLIDGEGRKDALFSAPKQPVSGADHAIGMRVAGLVRDGGTLQIGIGAMGDAVTAGLLLRHEAPERFARALDRLGGPSPPERHVGAFEEGLYAASEMFVDGFMHLYRAGILKRRAGDGALLHAGFFVGTREFYAFLRDLPEEERALFQMRGISFVNELYGEEEAKRADRHDATFVNSAMMATTLGAVVSDALEDGRVVSGVGGQYNFVAQAFALEGARSVMTLKASREGAGGVISQILDRYAHVTIPRHLRDIVVTEYGVADLRGKSDRDTIAAMIAIADSRFQDKLVKAAQDAGKLEKGFEIAPAFRENSPDSIEAALAPFKAEGALDPFPLGSDFDAVELRLLPALAGLRRATRTPLGLLGAAAKAAFSGREEDEQALKRLGLDRPAGARERIYRKLVSWALAEFGRRPSVDSRE